MIFLTAKVYQNELFLLLSKNSMTIVERFRLKAQKRFVDKENLAQEVHLALYVFRQSFFALTAQPV